MACNTSNIKEMKYGRPQTVMFTAGGERPNGTIVTLGATYEGQGGRGREYDHVRQVTFITQETNSVIGKSIIVAPEINEQQYRLIDGKLSEFKLKENETYTAYDLSKHDRIEYTYSDERFEGAVTTFTVGAFVKINNQGKFEVNGGGNAGNSAFRVVTVVDTHLPFTLAVNTGQNQPGALLPTVGKKIKLEVLN